MRSPFTTNDLVLAAYLDFKGFSYISMDLDEAASEVTWTFERTPELEEEVVIFSGENDMRAFALIYNALRKRMNDLLRPHYNRRRG